MSDLCQTTPLSSRGSAPFLGAAMGRDDPRVGPCLVASNSLPMRHAFWRSITGVTSPPAISPHSQTRLHARAVVGAFGFDERTVGTSTEIGPAAELARRPRRFED